MYLIKQEHKESKNYKFICQGHSELTSNAKKVSKYYAFDSILKANRTVRALERRPDAQYYYYSIIDCVSEGIEVV
jgi:hypothetical protein